MYICIYIYFEVALVNDASTWAEWQRRHDSNRHLAFDHLTTDIFHLVNY